MIARPRGGPFYLVADSIEEFLFHFRQAAGETFRPALALIDFRQQASYQNLPPFNTISAADLLDGKSGPDFDGKAILVGLTAIDASD
jgi:hypothetical protein